MAHLIVVGRSDSGAQEAFRQLVGRGLSPAKPSAVHGLLPQDINAKLLANTPSQSSGAGGWQATPGSAWDSLALDLLIANTASGQSWGWYDQSALPLMTFWGGADSSAHFLLIYNHPAKALETARDVSGSALQSLVADWCTFNAQLLSFFNRNKQRCILVNANSFDSDQEKVSQMLFERLGLELSKENIASHKTETSTKSLYAEICSLAAEEFSDALAIFEELEVSASIAPPIRQQSRAHILLSGYKAQADQQIEEGLLVAQLHATQEELRLYYLENEKSRKELERVRKELLSIRNGFQQQANKIKELSKPLGAVERVSNHLSYRIGKTLVVCSSSILGWLCIPAVMVYQVLDFKSTQRRLGKANQLPLNAYADAKPAKQIQSYLSYRLGAAIVNNSGTLSGWFRMPSAIRQALNIKQPKL